MTSNVSSTSGDVPVLVSPVQATGRAAIRLFLLPGELVCDAIGASAGDDRAMIRSLVNMLAWNTVAVLGVVLW